MYPVSGAGIALVQTSCLAFSGCTRSGYTSLHRACHLPIARGTTASDDLLSSCYLLHAPYVLNSGPCFFMLTVQADHCIFSYQYSYEFGRLLLLVSPKQKAAARRLNVMGFEAKAFVESQHTRPGLEDVHILLRREVSAKDRRIAVFCLGLASISHRVVYFEVCPRPIVIFS